MFTGSSRAVNDILGSENPGTSASIAEQETTLKESPFLVNITTDGAF